jgi:Zn-dependent metalloprotease
MTQFNRNLSGIVPPMLLLDVARRNPDSEFAINYLQTLVETQKLWTSSAARKGQIHRFKMDEDIIRRFRLGEITLAQAARQVYDAQNKQRRPGVRARFEDDAAHKDAVINACYEYLGIIRDYYWKVHGRNSIDANGMLMKAICHYGKDYLNAFWDSEYMTMGDGDGVLFATFVLLNVIAHEMAHGVTEHAVPGGIDYWGMAGATNEFLSDVGGANVESWHEGVNAKNYHWLIGKGLWVPAPAGSKAVRRALRDMLNPGTAYNDPRLGKDPQPAHMDQYWKGSGDNGGVHINSGILNRMYALFARSIEGETWEETIGKADRIFYAARPNFGNRPSFYQVVYWATEACAIYSGAEEKTLRDKLTAAAAAVGLKGSKVAVDDITPVAADDDLIVVE